MFRKLRKAWVRKKKGCGHYGRTERMRKKPEWRSKRVNDKRRRNNNGEKIIQFYKEKELVMQKVQT